MQTLGSPASLVAAIREDADAEVERLRETTETELASIQAQAKSANVAIADREEKLAAVRRASEESVAKQEWEGRRAAIEQRELWIQRVVAKGQERWANVDASQLNGLIREALSRMPSGACEVAVNVRDLEVVDVPDARVTAATVAGGCIVTMDNMSFDNSYEARSRRLEPEWRGALSGMYTP